MVEKRVFPVRPRTLPEPVPAPVEPITRPFEAPLDVSTPRLIEEAPDWYVVALGQADRVFGEAVYRSLSQIANGGDWTETALTTFQTGVVRGIELRNAVINKLQGIVALEALSVPDKEKSDAVQRVQPQARKLPSGRGNEVLVASHVRSPRREF